MQTIAPTSAHGNAPVPPPVAADLHGHLTTARHDLERLQAILADACAELLRHFDAATHRLQADAAADPAAAGRLARVAQHLAGAVTALQFQDLASQLIAHTDRRLHACADQVAGAALNPGAGMPANNNPVAQAAMRSGSIELF